MSLAPWLHRLARLAAVKAQPSSLKGLMSIYVCGVHVCVWSACVRVQGCAASECTHQHTCWSEKVHHSGTTLPSFMVTFSTARHTQHAQHAVSRPTAWCVASKKSEASNRGCSSSRTVGSPGGAGLRVRILASISAVGLPA